MEINRRAALGLLATLPLLSVGGNELAKPKKPVSKGELKLGKLPARHTCQLKLRDYIVPDKLPPLPAGDFGHWPLVSDWQVLGNDTVGDCAIAEPYHALMQWNRMADVTLPVDTPTVVKAYSAITGYNPKDPSSDRGSDLETVAEYWQNTGLTDAAGKVHKIDAFLALEPGNMEELWYGIHLFGGAGIGVAFPKEWMDAFKAGQPWTNVTSPDILGGHAIWAGGRKTGYVNVVTWGVNQLLSQDGYEQFNDETVVYLDSDMFADINGTDIDGFDWQQLQADIRELANGPELGTWADDGGYLP
jgi:hypothetical protein